MSVIFKEKIQTKRILVVDDEPDVVRILSKSLMLNGYEVITANDGLECLAKAENELPDLILLDNLMPNMDGQTTLAKLKDSKKTEGIPVIMVTALADEKNITTSQKGGAVEYEGSINLYSTLSELPDGNQHNGRSTRSCR